MSGDRYSPREMLERLIAFDTTSHLSNLPLIEFVTDYLAGHGIEAITVANEDGTKAALYATIGDATAGGVVLSGHTDVVPVADQDWSTDPFELAEADGKLYGRGTCDMKGFIAIALAMVPDFKAQKLAQPIHLALSYDEEVGCIGIEPLIRHVTATLPRPKLVIVGEPTSMRVVNAHKGTQRFCTDVKGHEAHSSATHVGVNAVMYAAEAISELNRIAAESRRRGDPSGRFEPPYTTVHVGTVEGGTAVNIVPRSCSFEWEVRAVPGDDGEWITDRYKAFTDDLVQEMRMVSERTGIETRKGDGVPVFAPQDGSPAESLALKLARQNDTHTVAFATEAGHFQNYGIPAVVCGPGDIEQAHKPDEFIELSQIEACVGFMQRLIKHQSA